MDTKEILLNVKEIFLKTYSPESDFRKVTEFMSTKEIYESIQKIYPSNKYEVDDIITWLLENNFTIFEMTPLSFKWALRKTD